MSARYAHEMGETASILGRRTTMSGAADVGKVGETGDVQHESEAVEVSDVVTLMTQVRHHWHGRGDGEGEGETGKGDTGEMDEAVETGQAGKTDEAEHPILLVLSVLPTLPVFSSWRNSPDEHVNAPLARRFLDELLRPPWSW
ncbi:uncharacterized protein BXZ73DRAFT_107584 [Epithele typhae]|uniref:uncharacterized protein n=1 Tax=Epithele typhae TaxID=378194 RepID=UPI002007643C|nr:uncharacterized protein BXZ73DRAFT_107584 [Epithele typhae]KAH9912140.1 hypothetical protein BXZ73DRAFT_107584 [Epithele typhae]